jgi:hypothetical protein
LIDRTWTLREGQHTMSPMQRPRGPTSCALGLTLIVIAGCGRVGFRSMPSDAAVGLDAPGAMDAPLLDARGPDAWSGDAPGIDAWSGDAPWDAPLDAPATDGGNDGGSDAPSARDVICRSPSTLSCLTFDADPAPPWETWSTIDGLSVRRRLADGGFRGGALEIAIPASESGAGLRLPITGESFRSGVYVSAWVRVARARDRKSTRLNSSHRLTSRMPSSA